MATLAVNMVTIIVGCIGMIQACTLDKSPRKYTMTEILDMAPIVVYGKDIYHATYVNHATFEVYCIFKSKNVTINNTIYLDKVALPHSCTNSRVKVNQTYVVALETFEDAGQDVYRTYEPDSLNKATFPATTDTLALTANLCGVSNASVPSGGSLDECPQRTLFGSNCTEPESSTASPVTKIGLVNMAIAIVSVFLFNF